MQHANRYNRYRPFVLQAAAGVGVLGATETPQRLLKVGGRRLHDDFRENADAEAVRRRLRRPKTGKVIGRSGVHDDQSSCTIPGPGLIELIVLCLIEDRRYRLECSTGATASSRRSSFDRRIACPKRPLDRKQCSPIYYAFAFNATRSDRVLISPPPHTRVRMRKRCKVIRKSI